jgi:hypothetical protein
MARINEFQVTQNDVQCNGLIYNVPDSIQLEDAELALEIDKGRHGSTKKPMSSLLAHFKAIDLTTKGEKLYEDFMADLDRKGKKVEKEVKERAKPGPKPKDDKKD